MSDRTIYPGMTAWGIVPDSVAHVIAATWKYGNSYTNSKEIATALGLDPDTVLTKDCPTCEGHGETVDPAGDGWPCDNGCKNGTIEVNRVMVVPVEVAEWLDQHKTPNEVLAELGAQEPTAEELAGIYAQAAEDRRALRIGRAVVANRDAMVATVSFLASVIRGGEPYTPEVNAAVSNFYERWDRILAAGERT